MELTMFERLLQLPMFQGLTTQELSEVMAHVRLNFVNYVEGDEIVMQGDSCRQLIHIIGGEVAASYQDPNGRFTLHERLPQLKVLEPYNLFGMYQKFSRTYTFATDGITLAIEKPVVLRRLLANDIVKINYLNIACNRYQQTLRMLDEHPGNSVKEKIARFVLAHSVTPRGTKEVQVKMLALADIIQETRLNVSIALNSLQDDGFITMQRGGFTVADLQALVKAHA